MSVDASAKLVAISDKRRTMDRSPVAGVAAGTDKQEEAGTEDGGGAGGTGAFEEDSGDILFEKMLTLMTRRKSHVFFLPLNLLPDAESR